MKTFTDLLEILGITMGVILLNIVIISLQNLK